jgi:hypothetical protein
MRKFQRYTRKLLNLLDVPNNLAQCHFFHHSTFLAIREPPNGLR